MEVSARNVADILDRRIRPSFLDKESSFKVLPRVVEILAQLEDWSAEPADSELKTAMESLR